MRIVNYQNKLKIHKNLKNNKNQIKRNFNLPNDKYHLLRMRIKTLENRLRNSKNEKSN